MTKKLPNTIIFLDEPMFDRFEHEVKDIIKEEEVKGNLPADPNYFYDIMKMCCIGEPSCNQTLISYNSIAKRVESIAFMSYCRDNYGENVGQLNLWYNYSRIDKHDKDTLMSKALEFCVNACCGRVGFTTYRPEKRAFARILKKFGFKKMPVTFFELNLENKND